MSSSPITAAFTTPPATPRLGVYNFSAGPSHMPIEVIDQIREELARRSGENPLVPLDRDPVPGRYSELVRRYYEQLGRDRQAP